MDCPKCKGKGEDQWLDCCPACFGSGKAPVIPADPVQASQENDECQHCTMRGHLKNCLETPCHIHNSWYAKQIAQLAKVEAE